MKYTSIIPHKTNDFDLNNRTTIFTAGEIRLDTNISSSSVINRSSSYSPYYTYSDAISESQIKDNVTLNLSFENITNYVKYQNFAAKVKVSLENIANQYPAALHVKKKTKRSIGNNISFNFYNASDNTSRVRIITNFISNPLSIYFLDNINFQIPDGVNDIRNFTLRYEDYVLIYNNTEYNIVGYTPPKTSINSSFDIVVEGNPFEIGASSVECYIKPKDVFYDEFNNNIDSFEKYLLSKDGFIINSKTNNTSGVLVNYQYKLIFPYVDDYNIDVSEDSRRFNSFYGDLYSYALSIDELDANILKNRLVDLNIQNLELSSLDDFNIEVGDNSSSINDWLVASSILYDDIRSYINGLRTLNTLTFDGIDNMPDELVRGYVNNKGFNVKSQANTDLEFWKLLGLSANYIIKHKGTREGLEYIFKFLNIPLDIVEFNTYIIGADGVIDVEYLKYLYESISDSFEIANLPVDNDGFPVIPTNSPNNYYQMFGAADGGMSYFYQFFNLLPIEFTGSSIVNSGVTTTIDTLKGQNYEFSGDSIGYSIYDDGLSSGSCYTLSASTINDPYPTDILDVCGCKLPIDDLATCIDIVKTPLDEVCGHYIIDVVYTYSGDSVILNVEHYGGTPPYLDFGVGSGTFNVGDTYNIFSIDDNGCVSNIVNGTVICQDTCVTNKPVVDFSYECITDDGKNTGFATINVNVSGGTPPYTFIGGVSGNVVGDGEIITIVAVDALGCESDMVGDVIVCPAFVDENCTPIELDASLEVVEVNLANKSAKVNVVYTISALPFSVYIDNVELNISGNGGDDIYVIGSPIVQNFNTIQGAETVSLSYIPSDVTNAISIDVTINITLTNECTYTDTFTLTVNPRSLGNSDLYNKTLT